MLQGKTPEEAWNLMEPLTQLGKVFSDLKIEVEIPEDIEVLGIEAGKHNLQRIIYYTLFKCYWNDLMNFEDNVHVNYDWYYPKFAWRHNVEEVLCWLKQANLKEVHKHVDSAGITIRAKK